MGLDSDTHPERPTDLDQKGSSEINRSSLRRLWRSHAKTDTITRLSAERYQIGRGRIQNFLRYVVYRSRNPCQLARLVITRAIRWGLDFDSLRMRDLIVGNFQRRTADGNIPHLNRLSIGVLLGLYSRSRGGNIRGRLSRSTAAEINQHSNCPDS